MLKGSSRGERHVRGLKTPRFFMEITSRSWQEPLAFFSLGERVAACGDRACASVLRSDRGSESNFWLWSFRGWDFRELISLTSLLFLIAGWISSFGGADKSCRSFLARGAGPCVATDLVFPSIVDRGSGSSLRARSEQRIGKSRLCPHLFPLHSGIGGWGSADTPPERLGFRGCLQLFVSRSSVLA